MMKKLTTVLFNWENPKWKIDRYDRIHRIADIERDINFRLKIDGHLTLKQVCMMLGSKTCEDDEQFVIRYDNEHRTSVNLLLDWGYTDYDFDIINIILQY